MGISIGRGLGNLRMRTIIVSALIICIGGAIGAVTATLYVSLKDQAYRQAAADLGADMGVAASLFGNEIRGTKIEWTPEGTISRVEVFAIMPFVDHHLVDGIGKAALSMVSIYEVKGDPAAITAKSTTLSLPDGTRALAETIAPGTPTYAAVMAGQAFRGETVWNGVPHFALFHPVIKANGDVTAVLAVGTPLSAIEAGTAETLRLLAIVGAAVTLALGALGYLLALVITAPIPRLAKTMQTIAEGDYATSVPYLENHNEIGAMARAVEIFRENGLQVARLTEAEAARIIRDQSARTEMMQTLQLAFGEVVDAAIAGDFSKRVAAQFPDAELNGLAKSVNALVETVDRGLNETGTVLAALARTDLTQRMHGDYAGAFAKLKADTNAVGDTLTGIVAQLRNTSRALKTATGEILSGANDLSERTTRQAATIEQTSATMEQIAETVAANAGMAENASAKAQSVYAAAEKGGAVMGQANEAMSRITQSSARISNVIGLIDDIAFQTNLLALNASVEAARAGEAGKGFAVVAVEVRRLAQSAAEASREVKVLIEQSAAEVRDGSKLVADAAGTLTGMLQAVHENTTLLEQIARASRQQSQAIGEVNTGVRQMDEMTQHNAALVEQTNAAIEQTEAQASELDRVVDVFTIDAVHATRVQKPQPARPQRPARAYLSEGNAAIAQDWAEF